MISEIRTRGAGGASDEFVELYNATGAPVTLDATWALEGRSAGGSMYTTRWKGAGGVIPAYGHFLITGSSYVQMPAGDDMLSVSVTDAMSLRLVSGANIVDALCFYYDAVTQAAFTIDYSCEGTTVSNLPHNNGPNGTSNSDVSLERKPGGAAGNCVDTNDTAADFLSTTPAYPQSTLSAPTP